MRHIFSALLLAGLLACPAAAQAPGASGAGKSTPAAEGMRPGGRAASAGGVDGVNNGNFGFHTNREDKPWWQVDLAKGEPLDRVVQMRLDVTPGSRALPAASILERPHMRGLLLSGLAGPFGIPDAPGHVDRHPVKETIDAPAD